MAFWEHRPLDLCLMAVVKVGRGGIAAVQPVVLGLSLRCPISSGGVGGRGRGLVGWMGTVECIWR